MDSDLELFYKYKMMGKIDAVEEVQAGLLGS